jgi:hypothetical protein
VPLKVDFMRLLNDTENSQVNRFVILTDSLLMVYDEEAKSENFYKKIVYVAKAKVTHNKKKLEMVLTEESKQVKVVMFFRDEKHYD